MFPASKYEEILAIFMTLNENKRKSKLRHEASIPNVVNLNCGLPH